MVGKLRLLVLGCMIVFGLGLAGCGGGGGDSAADWSLGGSGYLGPGDLIRSDNTYYDVKTFTAPEDGNITVSMSSRDFVTWVVAFRGTGSSKTTIAYARDYVTFYAEAGVTYTIYLNTVYEGDTGPYTWSAFYTDYRSGVTAIDATPELQHKAALKETITGTVNSSSVDPTAAKKTQEQSGK